MILSSSRHLKEITIQDPMSKKGIVSELHRVRARSGLKDEPDVISTLSIYVRLLSHSSSRSESEWKYPVRVSIWR